MALNEITKGMSNAAEQINANFKELDKTVIKNAAGNYIKNSDGTLVCWNPKLTLTYTEPQRLVANWTPPVEFLEGTPSCVAQKITKFIATRFSTSVESVEYQSTNKRFIVSLYATGNNTFSSGDTYDVQLTAHGFWK